MNEEKNNLTPYKKWCRVLDQKKTKGFLENSYLEFIDLNYETSLNLLQPFVEKKYRDESLLELKRLEVTLYSNNEYQEAFILDSNNKLYIRSFFFHTLTQKTLKELTTFILFFYIQKKEILIDLILDLVNFQESFLDSRHALLKKEEFEVIYASLTKQENNFIRALMFVSLLHYPDSYSSKINMIETISLKEIYFSQKMKKILNLEESDYEYIQEDRPWESLSTEGKEKFTVIKHEIENNQITIEEYVQNYFEKKKILFWCLWTISPFLAIDIGRLIYALNEYKTIKRVYLDIPQSSQEVINCYIANNNFPESEVEYEIKKIYPSIVSDYAKETLPYLKLLERLQLFKIPQVCIGEEGDTLSRRLPFLRDNKLEFEIDENWEKSIHKEVREIEIKDDQQLTIFFYFLKPMNYLLPYAKENEAVETLIHTDPFTGYGPNQSENRLSYYSHYHPLKQQLSSFVLSELNRFSLRDEKVVSFPYKEDDYFRINDDLFNRFYLFNSLLFSGFSGGRGQHKSVFTPSPNHYIKV